MLKKEVEHCRKEDRPHGLFKEYNLNIKPFNHPDPRRWQSTEKEFNICMKNIIYSFMEVDDIMVNEKDELVVVDFKATTRENL